MRRIAIPTSLNVLLSPRLAFFLDVAYWDDGDKAKKLRLEVSEFNHIRLESVFADNLFEVLVWEGF